MMVEETTRVRSSFNCSDGECDLNIATNINANNILEENTEYNESIKDDSELSDEERVLLYEKALKFLQLDNCNHALLCFLGCLKGLRPSSKSKFTVLPQCLTHVSQIYASAGDYQKAVEFMQGTKLYYETAIIEAGIQVDQYKKETGSDFHPLDLDPCLDEARRANEYERLSNSCMEQHKFQLALEYCGKAAKLRQEAYGNDHDLTVKSLDMFTLIYSEMGKSQYSEAMNKFGDINTICQVEKRSNQGKMPEKNCVEEKFPTLVKEKEAEMEEKPVKQSKIIEEIEDSNVEGPAVIPPPSQKKPKKVQFSSKVSTHQIPFTPNIVESNITSLHLFIFFIVSLLIALTFTVFWCAVLESDSCPSAMYLTTRLQDWYHGYFKRRQ